MLQGKIRTGELDREISFIKENVSRGTSNQDKIDSWALVDENHTVWARKIELKGNEVVIGDQLKYIQKTVFTIRYRTDLNEKNRVVFDTKVYEIVSITEVGDQRKTFLDIVANYIDNETFDVGVGAFSNAFSSAFA
jgi:SPP1 family predicted phage head-tail adaptor